METQNLPHQDCHQPSSAKTCPLFVLLLRPFRIPNMLPEWIAFDRRWGSSSSKILGVKTISTQRLPDTPNIMPQHAPYDTNHLISCLRHTWPWINFKPPKPTRALYLQNKVWMVKYRQVSSGRACQFNPIVKPKLLVWLLVFFSSCSLIIHRA